PSVGEKERPIRPPAALCAHVRPQLPPGAARPPPPPQDRPPRSCPHRCFRRGRGGRKGRSNFRAAAGYRHASSESAPNCAAFATPFGSRQARLLQPTRLYIKCALGLHVSI